MLDKNDIHTISYKLNNIKILLSKLDNPHLKLPPTIHIAGTNGKGSTVAMLKQIFLNSGYKVHTYTSPHLIKINERIVISNKFITNSYLLYLHNQIKKIIEKELLKINFFEKLTVIAFLAFSENPADLLILETGIGGLYDTTNVIKQAILSIITPISYDHMELLGYNIKQIAYEKAGIIKFDTPCIISKQDDEVYDLLIKRCKNLNSLPICYSKDFTYTYDKNLLRIKYYNDCIIVKKPSLLGEHQFINASTVTAAIQSIKNKFYITNNNISQGLESTIWPARIQKIDTEMYKDFTNNNIQIWLDGAHNKSGAEYFSYWVKNNLQPPIFMILSMTKNKNVEEFCSFFYNIIQICYTVPIKSNPTRSYESKILCQEVNKAKLISITKNSIEEALYDINKKSNKIPTNVIITGSLFLAADFLKLINFQLN